LKIESETFNSKEYSRLRVGPYDDDTEARSMFKCVDKMFQIKLFLIPIGY